MLIYLLSADGVTKTVSESGASQTKETLYLNLDLPE
jgi:hypothetical protein